VKAVFALWLIVAMVPLVSAGEWHSASSDSLILPQRFSFANQADTATATIDSVLVRPDSTISVENDRHGILSRLIKPLALTVTIGGLLLWLYLQRGH
jgi:hypothetical protein